MVNREMTNRFPAKDNVPGDVLMEVSHLTGKYMPTCQDVSFELRAGEVLGVAGLVGSRRTELLSTIFGIMARESGEIKLNGKAHFQQNAASVHQKRLRHADGGAPRDPASSPMPAFCSTP